MRKTLSWGGLIGCSVSYVAALLWAWAGLCPTNVDLSAQLFHGQFTEFSWIRLHPFIQIVPQCSPKWRWKKSSYCSVCKWPIFLFAWIGGSNSLEHNLVFLGRAVVQRILGWLVPQTCITLFYGNREVRNDGRMWFKTGISFKRKII